MTKLGFLLTGCLVLPVLASASWTEVLRDDFDGGNEIGTVASQVPANATTANFSYDYVTTATTGLPAMGLPAGGDGLGLFLTANEAGAAVSTNSVLFGSAAQVSQATEAYLLPRLSTTNSSGGTIFGGIGVKISTPIAGGVTSGYWAEFRTDNSGSFGNYINLYKQPVSGAIEAFGRYYFDIGSGGIALGTLTAPNESRLITATEATAGNTWVKARLEYQEVVGGAQIRLIVNDVTIVDHLDTTPVAGGQGAVIVHDYFTSLSGPAGTVGLIYDYVKFDNFVTPPARVENWEVMQ
jgi:hypothetical protein